MQQREVWEEGSHRRSKWKSSSFQKNFYFSLIAEIIVSIFSGYKLINLYKACHVASYNWLLIHRGHGCHGGGMRSGRRDNGVHGSSCHPTSLSD